MLCRDYPTALPLGPCTGEDPKIYVGVTDNHVTHIRLRSEATGRLLQYAATEDGDGVYFEPDGDFIIGHTYLFQMMNGGVVVAFYPYRAVGYSLTPDTTLVDGVHAAFERVYDGGETFEHGDQFITLP